MTKQHTPVIEQIGYFDNTGQTKPAHNPCALSPCCVCGKVNGEDILYRSMMPMTGTRSYFFAYHKTCAGSDKIDAFEEAVVGEMFDWDDAAQGAAQ